MFLELGRLPVSSVKKGNSAYTMINEILDKLDIDIKYRKVSIVKRDDYYIVKEVE